MVFDNDRPIYIQLMEELKHCILSNKFQPGAKLPSVRELAMQMQVNPNTVQKALSELEYEKLIYTERTNGKFVTTDIILITEIKKSLAEEKMRKFLDDMNNIGFSNEEAIHCLEEYGGKQ